MNKKNFVKLGAVFFFAVAGVLYLFFSAENTGSYGIVFGNAGEDSFLIDGSIPNGSNSEAGEAIKDKGSDGQSDRQETYAQTIWVHICGEVKNAGVYELALGSRVVEAIQAAGGLTKEAAGEWMNQALTIIDGQRIYVPSKTEVAALSVSEKIAGVNVSGTQGVPFSGAPANSDGKININSADKEELMSLPGIGEARADAIIESRERDGPFETIEDIGRIYGISDTVYEKIKDKITV